MHERLLLCCYPMRASNPTRSTAYHNEELKSLTRYRFDKVKERAKLKSSIARLVCILFPELEKLVPSLHIASVYALLEEFPGAKQIAAAHLTRLKALLETASKWPLQAGYGSWNTGCRQKLYWLLDARQVP